ncbi:hypothetical protein Micbo1qcDRAFT_208791 [Microdochium bolleyi]|uniref:Uncharacterized protein n=1 Tax=Microdochium bolleyi TaxID=196109 RepID=A0A136IP17_9PEZI|nr:hypothetical protein Micbo1qcDRAFT_208791 [Microdochium bolleyi]
MVKINGVDFIVPRYGSDTHMVINGDGGSAVPVALSKGSVVVGDSAFPLPELPLPSPITVSSGPYQVVFSERRLPVPALLPPATPPAREFARKVAEDYIAFCKDMVEPASQLFYRMFEVFARFNADSEEVATALLGTEDAIFDALVDAAQDFSIAFNDYRQES